MRILALIVLALPALAQNYASYNNQPVARMSFLRKQFTPNKNMFGDSTLAALWMLNEGGSVPQMYDQSGNNFQAPWGGTPNVTTNSYYNTGKTSPWAGQFDGSTNCNVSPDTSSILTATASGFSILMWVNPASYPASGSFAEPIRKNAGFTVSDRGDTVGFQTVIFNGTGTAYGPTMPNSLVPLNAWTLLAVTLNGTNVSGYTNGTLYGSSAFSGSYATNNNAVYVGCNSPGTRFFPGRIGNIRIYNRALSQAEIQAIYNAENH